MVEHELIPTGRVFAAVVPPPEVVQALADRLDRLSLPGRLVPPPNWHVTLHFAGELDAVAYERWVSELDGADLPPSFRLRLEGLGAFPRPARATVLWVGVEGETLGELAAVVEEAAVNAGLGAEERPFRPHLTVSRVRPPADVRPLLDEGAGWNLAFRVEEFCVMAAVGSRYRVYERFSL